MAHHKESRVIDKSEGIHLNSSSVVNQDWDNAWDSEEEEKPAPSTGKTQSSAEVYTSNHGSAASSSSETGDDDVAEAWGWGGMFLLPLSTQSL